MICSTLLALTLGLSAASLVGCELKSGDPDATDTATTVEDTGTTAPVENDSDGDSILDIHEGIADSDNDGDPDYLDTDSDGDGIPDAIEAGDSDPATFPSDTDEDGTPDYLDDDSDENGIPDDVESGGDGSNPTDTDGDGDPVFRVFDNAGDYILDGYEMLFPS